MSQTLIRIHLRGRGPKDARKNLDEAKIDLTAKEAGQIIVVFALMLTFLIGMVGIAIDVTFAWRTGIEIQRAADAGALAGVVYLPGDLTSAQSEATAIVGQNGYTGANSHAIVDKNPSDDHQLDVTLTSEAPTFFVRLFGVDHWTITRKARAGFQLPVPMGSPEPYYGVYCLPTASHPNCDSTNATPGATPAAPVTNHGAWGAIQATGTDHGQGDAFIAMDDRTKSLGHNPHGGTNPEFDSGGYNYAVELPAGGTIYVFDPTACAVGDQLGTGDHYNDGGGWESGPKVYSTSTYYDVYNMTASPLNWALQPKIAGSGSLFEQEYQYDQSSKYGSPSYKGQLKPTSQDGIALKDCQEGATTNPAQGRYWHDKWWPVASGLGPGNYRLNITSAHLGAANWKATFENDWSIEGVGPGKPRVYGLGKMVQYNIIPAAGVQSFYLAQIGAENAGKTLEINLFDIGDIGGHGSLSVSSPNGNSYNNASFSYTSDANCGQTRGSTDACAASSRTSITVANGNNSSFNDTWLTIRIKLPSTYGCSAAAPCLKPAGETQQGWWKIQYTTSASANDTTTWMVNLVGNPVHLVAIP
jgi:Putative Flp pilus-assembly TadE/G-like